MPQFTDVLQIRTADDFLLRCLSPGEIFKFSLSSSLGREAVAGFMARAYRLDVFLTPFFTPRQYAMFRRLQAETGLLISGSVALQFFMRVRYRPSDLDLYVNFHHMGAVHAFLVAIGYVYQEGLSGESFRAAKERLDDVFRFATSFCPDNQSAKYSGRGLFAVFHYTKGNDVKIDLIATLFCPFQAILGFHSTCVMNVITYAHAISLYPHATLLESVSYQNKAIKPADDAAFDKYRGRGFTYITRDQALTRAEFRVHRRVGDEFCWIIPLRGEHCLTQTAKDDLVFANSWQLGIPESSYMFDYELLWNKRRAETSICLAEGKKVWVNRHRSGVPWSRLDPLDLLRIMRKVIRGGYVERSLYTYNYTP